MGTCETRDRGRGFRSELRPLLQANQHVEREERPFVLDLHVKKTGNESALMHCAIDDPAAFAREAGCELLEVRPFYADARRILKGKVGPYAKVAMAITDRTGRAFILRMKL